MFNTDREKAFSDKVLTVNDVSQGRELQKKTALQREDINELMTLISSTESKMLNLGLYDRYVLNKFFVWIREFCNVTIRLHDYMIKIETYRYQNNIIKNKDYLIPCGNKKIDWDSLQRDIPISQTSQKLLRNCQLLLQHTFKFLIDLYNNIGRTSLSIGAMGFMEMLKTKFEVLYNQARGSIQEDNIKIVKG